MGQEQNLGLYAGPKARDLEAYVLEKGPERRKVMTHSLFCRRLTGICCNGDLKGASTFDFYTEQPAVFHSTDYSIQVNLDKTKVKYLPKKHFSSCLWCAKTGLE